MKHHSPSRDTDSLAHEAARIICEESVVDYHTAKRKAAERLGAGPRAALPDNARIEAAVIEYQRLFGGEDYSRRLRHLRETAVRAMKLLAEFEPRLAGGVISGAISDAHRVQLHAFAEKAEMLDIFMQERGIPFEAGERDYRYSGGSIYRAPLVRFEADDVGIDVAVFPPSEQRHAPLSPIDGQPTKRLTLAQAQALLSSSPDVPAAQK
jgi:hypothetical protein